MKKYITTTLTYVNSDPHIGFAFEIVRADVWARFQRRQGNEVFFNTGTDEHGLKIYQKALELGIEPKEYCDRQSEKFKELRGLLNLSYDNFIRTTDLNHIKAAQEFWKQVRKTGFIYKKKYKTKYCVGCEMEKTDSELIEGKCPLHPNLEIQIIEEENYFFRFSVFQKQLLDLYEKNPEFVVPEKRFNEIKKFVEMGLDDFSISRLKEKMPWGVGTPDDSEHIMYVWFDALVNYISALGWPEDKNNFKEWWPVVQVAGKDNLRQQSAMWQAMLMAVGLPSSKQIFINSFLTSKGQKMSKSTGNVIAPVEMVEKFGIDGTRYLLLSLSAFGEDADITWENLVEKYNADLANGLGNLVSRVFNLIEKNFDGRIKAIKNDVLEIDDSMESFEFSAVLDKIREKIGWANRLIDETKIWELVKTDKEKAGIILTELLGVIVSIAEVLLDFMPESAEKILRMAQAEKIEKGNILFPRI